MRYDTLVRFWSEGSNKYNPQTHKHEKSLVKLDEQYCNVTDLGTAKQVELLGEIKQGSKTIRMIALPPNKYDYIKIAEDPHMYRFVSSLNVLKGYAMIVGQDNG
ncbi:hypothetical protein [Lactobacillus intestinalis]|uniref:hypothetical protein n=1 Tax=Lactobacillus intestinalis TaxID=151781 RepID=UPI0026348067|nr:hypothetical protein [Lactobacillus intestinalis]